MLSAAAPLAAGAEPAGRLALRRQPVLEQPVHDQVGIAADGRGEVQVGRRRQPEVAHVHHVVGRLLERAQQLERQRPSRRGGPCSRSSTLLQALAACARSSTSMAMP